MIFATELSVSTVVGGSGSKISCREVCIEVAVSNFSKNIPSSVSVAEAITLQIILHYICIGLSSESIAKISLYFLGLRPR